jgi:hypothetical protein
MLARLGFATALRADADILLLDEVLAVGDAHFQRKCFGVFDQLRRQGKTIVLVSHDLASVQRFCERVFWLDKGRLVCEGDAQEVINTYLGLTQGIGDTFTPSMPASQTGEYRWGDGRMQYVEGTLETADGVPAQRVRAGARVVLRLVVEAHEAVEEPVFGFLVRIAGETVYSTNSGLLGVRTGPFAAGERAEVRIPFTAGVANGTYVLNVAIADRETGAIHDWINHFIKFVVEDSRCGEGPADLGAGFECLRHGRATAVPSASARGRQ